jgi:PAS domain S-box-containing protein
MVMATATNLLVPLIFRASDLGKYGPFFSLIMIATVGHAIVRHRLMDIRVVIRRGAVYLVAVGVAGCVLFGLLLWSNALFHEEHRVPVREIVLALLVAVCFQPIKAVVQRGFDRYLYREPYDYQRAIRRASRLFAGTIDLAELVRHLDDVFAHTLRPEGIAVYVADEEDGEFLRIAAARSLPGPGQLRASVPTVAALAAQRKALFRDELGPDAPTALVDGFAALRAEVLVPLLTEDRLVGFLIVGAKRSGDPYFSDDADLLGTLADQAALAIRNAQRHDHVVQVNEEIQRILATIESAVVSVNTRGRIRLCNRAAETMLGASSGRLRGQPIGVLPAMIARHLGETIGSGESRPPIEISLPDAAGQLVPLMCSTAPLRGPHDVVLGAVAVLSDLSHIKALERERWRVERLASLEAIASGLVHEVRNPLVAIKTFIQLLPQRYTDPIFLETSTRAAERGIDRVETLLARFRALSSVPTQPLEPIDVSIPLQATIDLIRPQIEARGLRLRHVSGGPPRPLLGNASQLEQLFHNLCLNAIEAMQPGGELTVRLADLCEAGGTTLLVEISDTGSGIPEDLLPSIFNPFVTTKAKGSGLGLAICRTIADTHRATIRARNNTERPGCTFTVEFPVPAGTPQAAQT